MNVIEDYIHFSVALGIKKNYWGIKFIRVILLILAIWVSIGLILIGMAVIVIPVIIIAAALGILPIGLKKLGKLKDNISGDYKGRRSWFTGLDILGATVAHLVFVPVFGVVKCDGELQTDDAKYIEKMMVKWGYSKAYIENFVGYYRKSAFNDIKVAVFEMDMFLNCEFNKPPEARTDPRDITAIGKERLFEKSYELCVKMYENIGINSSAKNEYLDFLKKQWKL